MTKKIKLLKNFTIGCLSIHFLFVILVQFYDLDYTKNGTIKKIKDFYINPFFEQNWGMFSPTPPHGNQYFIIKYHTNTNNITIDIHEDIKNNSNQGLFNINQRLLKYQNGCYNDIIQKISKGNLDRIYADKSKSHGLESILNYSKLTLKNQKSFLDKINNKDSVFVDIYLINESLIPPYSKNKFEEKKYITLTNVYLTNKQSLYE
ncbi:DUF5819 family protein [Chryseobacterium sp. 22532]|jgi:hypothetical protein|uniref:DUF5819 family protein n=1 Tax=Chryseobacterium sp. 22532 TaxID=3453938 RepID=UPI003F8696CB